MDVSLIEFLRTGHFGQISLGSKKEDVRERFGDPRDVGLTSSRRREPAVWEYGDIEFGFTLDKDPTVAYISLNRRQPFETSAVHFLSSQPFVDANLRFQMSLPEYLLLLGHHEISYSQEDWYGEPVVASCGSVWAYSSKSDAAKDFLINKWIMPG